MVNRSNLFTGGITQIAPSQSLTPLEIVELIKGPTYKQQITELRETHNKELKLNLDYITPGGTFTTRANGNLIEHSGFLHLDIDKLPTADIETTKQSIIASPYTHICYLSPSGNGFKVWVKIPTVKDDITYKGFYEAVVKEYNLPDNTDTKTKDISRACFMSYDPDVYYNPQSTPFTQSIQQTSKSKTQCLDIDSEIIPILVKYWKSPHRNELAMYASGVLRKEGYGTTVTSSVITKVCKLSNDPEISNRLKVIEETFKKNDGEIKTFSGMKGILSPEDYTDFINILSRAKIEETESTELIVKQYSDYKNYVKNEEYIVEDFLYPGTLTMIHSPPANFKSMIAYYMSYCITNRKDFLNLKTNINPVLYIDAENSHKVIKERMEGMYNGLELTNPEFDLYVLNNFRIMNGKKKISEIAMTQIKDLIEKKEIKVLIIDTLHRIADYDENKADDITDYIWISLNR